MEKTITHTLPGITVIICCYNSAARLPRTLKHLADQIVPENIPWEILLVNNASTDNTVECARTTWNILKPGSEKLRIINEDNPGQMHARKKGAREAEFEYLVFCDDDNLLHKNYIYLSREVLLKDRMIGAAGGRNSPVTDAPAYPAWFESYKDKYAIGIPAAGSGDVTYRGFILGAGLITRAALFLEMFDDRYPSLLNGRNGEKLSTGDDFEYCKRLILRGYTLYYDERLFLDHFIPKERLTISYRDRLMKGIEDAGKVLTEYDHAIKVKNKVRNKSPLRLLILAPLRIFLAKAGISRRNAADEALALKYLTPFHFNMPPLRRAIKHFMNNDL